MTNSVLQTAQLYAEMLDEGGTFRGECPLCKRQKTFTVTRRDGGFVWNCYSTNCGTRGAVGVVVGGSGGSLVRTKPAAKAPTNPFKGSLERLNEGQRRFLEEKVGFKDSHIYKAGVKYAPVEDRFAFPIYNPVGRSRGLILRSYEPTAATKALTFMDVAEPHMSWYGPWDYEQNIVVVVEDIPSAVRASMHVGPVVALCGGDVGPDYIRELSSYALNIVWALDPDATGKAVALSSRYSFSFDSSRVLMLKKDLKNMSEPELIETLSEVKF